MLTSGVIKGALNGIRGDRQTDRDTSTLTELLLLKFQKSMAHQHPASSNGYRDNEMECKQGCLLICLIYSKQFYLKDICNRNTLEAFDTIMTVCNVS